MISFLIKFTLSFAISFLILSLEINNTPLFNVISEKTAPYKLLIINRGKEIIQTSSKIGKNLFENSTPSYDILESPSRKKDSTQLIQAAPQQPIEIENKDLIDDKDKILMKKIINEYKASQTK